jgi:hypothetical protein
MMNRIATSAAALTLLMTSVAFAQTDPAAPDAPPPAGSQAAPTTELPVPAVPGAGAQDSSRTMDQFQSNQDDDDEDEDEDEDDRRRGGDGASGSGEGDRGGGGGDRAGAGPGGGDGDRGSRHRMRGHPGWRMHHPGAMEMGAGGQGAVFRFSGGGDGPSLMIRCAARDSTEECVEAIMPMLDKLLQLRAAGAPAQ